MKKLQNVINCIQSYRSIFIVFLLVCIVTSIISFRYYENLHSTIRNESKNYLQEVSKRVGKNLDRVIQDNFAMLDIMSSTLEHIRANDIATVKTLLLQQQSHWNYDSILLIAASGNAYDIIGNNSTFMAPNDSMLTNMLSKKSGMATTQIINNKEYLVFMVPVNNMTFNGEKIITLAGCYAPSALEQVLSMTSFNDQAYSQIITKQGTVVTRANYPFAIKSGYNIFSTLSHGQIDNYSDWSIIKTAIKAGNSDQVSFSLDGIHRYLVYTPIQLSDWYLLTFVPFQAVNAKSDALLRYTWLICGFIILVFCFLITTLSYIFIRNRKTLEHIAYVDEITGGNTIQGFYKLASNTLRSFPYKQFVFLYTNFENFKVLNAQIGKENCDIILKHFNAYIASFLTENECIGRFSADNFCILLNYQNEETLLESLNKWSIGIDEYIHNHKLAWTAPPTKFGIYVITDNSQSLPDIVDRAKLALKENSKEISGSVKLRYAFYNDSTRQRIFREKQLADMMELALANREFQLYLQPKFKLPEEKINGAEALVRWVNSVEGMIYPDDFIPLFERNGFIIQLDLWMFEEVCRTMAGWIKRGLTPIKISVNFSRVHCTRSNFLTPYLEIANKYNIDKSLLEIELTESLVFEDSDSLINIIKQIKAAGFGCSMDDFGSGYSSLNLLQSIPVDTLKIDKIFFRNKLEELDRTEAVISGIIQTAKYLSMTTVAEGVEHREQVDMLKRIGCDYIQGFVFAKPMDINSFEQIVFNPNLRQK